MLVNLTYPIHSTPPIAKNIYTEILLHYRQLFIKGDVIIGEWGIFGAEVFLHYSQFFVKGNFIIDGVECLWDRVLINTPGLKLNK